MYDQLNRLKESSSYETGLTSNVWNPTTYGNSYYNAFSYDAMGNIENQIRYSRNGTLIDNLTYHYQKSGGKLVRNRLYHLNDAQTNASAFGDDIDNMLAFHNFTKINIYNNYNYDEEGRLVKDSTEKISKIVWRVDGKVKEIQRNGGSAKWLRFDYDAMGHRIAKHVYNNTGTTLERSTYYILDAQGNTISTYDHEVVGGTAQFNLKERNIFGSSRIGSKQDSMNVLTATITQNYTQVLGTKYYEFSNHLGNVLTVYSDVKVALDVNSDGIVDGFRVPIRNIADYSPFGVQLDGRTVQGDFYRRGFNGMEKDDEVKGGGNSYDFGARMYDARVGRWLSIDPLAGKYPSFSPYDFVVNNPLIFIDPDGKRPEWIIGTDGKPVTIDLNSPTGYSSNMYKSALDMANAMSKTEQGKDDLNRMITSKDKAYDIRVNSTDPNAEYFGKINLIKTDDGTPLYRITVYVATIASYVTKVKEGGAIGAKECDLNNPNGPTSNEQASMMTEISNKMTTRNAVLAIGAAVISHEIGHDENNSAGDGKKSCDDEILPEEKETKVLQQTIKLEKQ